MQVGHLFRLPPLGRRADGFGEVGVVLLDHGDHFWGHSVGRAQLELAVSLVKHIDHAGLGAGKLRRPRYNGVEHRLQIERRVNRVGDVAERAQLLDRATKLICAGAQFVEEPHVLDCDNGLLGEILYQLDLFVGEWTNFLAVNVDSAY